MEIGEQLWDRDEAEGRRLGIQIMSGLAISSEDRESAGCSDAEFTCLGCRECRFEAFWGVAENLQTSVGYWEAFEEGLSQGFERGLRLIKRNQRRAA